MEVGQASWSGTDLGGKRGRLLGCHGGTSTADRGDSTCRGSEAGKRLAGSRKSTGPGMAGGWGVCEGVEQRQETRLERLVPGRQ